jgi:NAD(P)-dependent dehydrogenase (short-subunit alcohol dehydrogenase family)
LSFENKVVLVTGASRGIGRAVAQEFAQVGVRVAIHYNHNRAAAEETLSTLPGGPHKIIQADQGRPADARDLVEAVIELMGGIDILVNNAGIYEEHRLEDVSYEQWLSSWEKTLAVNLLGPANITFWAARHMIEKGGGRIVNISSRGAFRGEPDGPAYGASKAGLNAMSQSLAKALAPHNIFVCVVAPGWVETDMAAETLSGPGGEAVRNQSPLGRVAYPEEVARTVRFLASEGTDFLTGCIVDVNGASYLRS